jgi:hypothetical protein
LHVELHTPLSQLSVATWVLAQPRPQAPQLDVLVLVFVSQPSSALPPVG